MNTIHILGRLAKKEMKAAEKDGKTLKICEFTVASTRNNSSDDTDFINCTAFEKPAAYLENYATVGQRLYIIGTVVMDTWETENNEKRYKTYVKAHTVQNADNRRTEIEVDNELPFN